MPHLGATEQWDLHAFYGITERLDEKQAVAYRTQTTREHPSLPQRAGRAYAHLVAIEEHLATLPRLVPVVRGAGKRSNRRSKHVNISVRTLVRPTIDYEKLAAAFLEHAEHMRRKQEDEESKAA